MHVKKEVYEKCLGIVDKEISTATNKLRTNRFTINTLAKEQRILKATIGELHKTKRVFTVPKT